MRLARRAAAVYVCALVVHTALAAQPGQGPRAAERAKDEVVAVPGGLSALAGTAYLTGRLAEDTYFADFCRSVVRHGRYPLGSQFPGFAEDLDLYVTSVAELSRLSEGGKLTLSLRVPSRKPATLRVLKLLGWRVKTEPGVTRIEPGDEPEDAVRTTITAMLGWDAVSMANRLARGDEVQCAIPSGRALVREARSWEELAGGLPPAGFPQLFARNPRFAMAYAGLSSMGPAGEALVSGMGLRRLVDKHALALWLYGDGLSVSDGRVVVPGGLEAEPVWERLSGASPRAPQAFFRALLEKDGGRLVAFYVAVARGDRVRQHYFTASAARAERFYRWFRNSEAAPEQSGSEIVSWQQELLWDMPIDSAGEVWFPGGRAAWTDSTGPDGGVLQVPRLEALAPVARVERLRRRPLDEGSARLLAARYGAWRHLFPYFEELPGLGQEEFEALAAFQDSVRSRPRSSHNAILGQWHSLVKLIELGVRAGSLSPTDAARGFRRVCQALTSVNFSARALAALRELAGGATDLDEAVADGLLRLGGERRAAFERVKELLGVPDLARAAGETDEVTLAALSGLVYAAVLDPNHPLVREDPSLLRKHAFVDAVGGPAAFARSGLQLRGDPPGSYFHGGFMRFEDLAADLPPGPLRRATDGPRRSPEQGAGDPEIEGPLYRASSRLVEVYASVTDPQGRFLNGLQRDDFTVLDNGEPVDIQSFDGSTSEVSVALLLDTTGSMRDSFAALKLSVLKLIDVLRPLDAVAVYAFNDTVRELQPFTAEKGKAKQAVLGMRVWGGTALHDSLRAVAQELSSRPGKRAIVLFTDGVDTASALTMDPAIRQAKMMGAPVYIVACGEALTSRSLMRQLGDVARATGGLSFAVRDARAMEAPFRRVAEDLTNGYVLSFRTKAREVHEWRSLRTLLRASKGLLVRAREGYFAD